MAGVELRVSGFNSLVSRNPCKRANTCAFLVAAADGPVEARTELDYKRVTPDGRYETRKCAGERPRDRRGRDESGGTNLRLDTVPYRNG